MAVVDNFMLVYPPTPGAVFDPRLTATVCRGTSGGSCPSGAPSVHLEVEDAPSTPQTRDPGHGRPPFTSSRLRAQSDAALLVVLTCSGESGGRASGTVGCWFDVGTSLRGVGVDLPIARSAGGSTLSFTLPPPGRGHLAAHYYLNATIVNPAGEPNFARGRLFYFWVDQPTTAPQVALVDVSRFGVIPNSTAMQTVGIQHLLDTVAVGSRLLFPPGSYRTGPLVLHRPVGMQLAPGVLLQHHASTNGLAIRKSGARVRADAKRAPPQRGQCHDPAFLTVSAAVDVFIGGRGSTVDANGFNGSSLCIADSSNVTVESLLLRGSCSWSTHIFRSRMVVASGVKIFSGADGLDPDNSQDVTVASAFIHSNDDSIAVKATTEGQDTERITISNGVFSTKKSCLKVGTESLANFDRILFTDIEGFDLDRGMVLYPSDGGRFSNIRWQRVRFSSFYPYADEGKAGAVFDFESRHRGGLSQLTNITASQLDSVVVASSIFRGASGAPIQDVRVTGLMLRVQSPRAPESHDSGYGPVVGRHSRFLFECEGQTGAIDVAGMNVSWGSHESEWGGVQAAGSVCITTQ